ncbi:MAG: hypothetical protein K0U39_01700 [Alphaproteobacteria bacterium]|nr:hypothetical protein [Alphaproteobacteria bacterium]
MKYLLILSAMLAFAVPNIALAQFDIAKPAQTETQKLPTQRQAQQFKENYIEIDIGAFVQSGADNNEYTRMARDIAVDVFAENGRNDLNPNNVRASLKAQGYFRLAYGYYAHSQFSFEFATTGVAVENVFVFDDENANSINDTLADSFDDTNYYSINILEVAGVYYIPISDNFKFTLRGGIGFYSWLDEDNMPLIEEYSGQKYSGTTFVTGIGVDISNVHLEYRTYDLSYIEVYKNEKYQLYGTAGVFTVGYKFRF